VPDVSGAVADPTTAQGYFALFTDVTAGGANIDASTPSTFSSAAASVALSGLVLLDAKADTAFPDVTGNNLYELDFTTGVTTNLISTKIIVRATSRINVSQSGGASNGDLNANNTIVIFDRQIFTGAATGAILSSVKQLTPDALLVTQARTSKMTRKVNVYSFGLKPEEHQPSGTCNFSRIDSAKLEFKSLSSTTDTISIYAVNYNVLRIMSGMGGLAYSN
jgi:hypothetical protein